MNRTEIIKREILRKYASVRACDIPNATIVSALNNGIDGMAYGKVKKMCDCLELDINTFEPICKESIETQQLKRLLAYYSRMTTAKQKKVLEYIKDIDD